MRDSLEKTISIGDTFTATKKEQIDLQLEAFYNMIVNNDIMSLLRKAHLADDEEYSSMLRSVVEQIKQENMKIPVVDSSLIEEFSKIEHEQWLSWARSTYDKVLPEHQEKWSKLLVGYSALSESEKSLSRLWATRAVGVFYLFMMKSLNQQAIEIMEHVKFALKLHDQHQFDPDTIEVYKNSVIKEVDDLISGGFYEGNKGGG